HLITDQGTQFTSDGFKRWCRRRSIRQRYGAVGAHGSIAVIERFFRTLKSECTRVLATVPLHRRWFQQEVALFLDWYNGERHRFAGCRHAASSRSSSASAFIVFAFATENPRVACKNPVDKRARQSRWTSTPATAPVHTGQDSGIKSNGK